MSHIMSLAVEAIAAHLYAKLVTELPETDTSRFTEVRAGRLQKDPTSGYYALVHPGDPEDDKYGSILYTPEVTGGKGFSQPFENGGGSLWWERGSVEVGIFMVNKAYTREVARDVAFRCMGLVEKNLAGCTAASQIEDEFGCISRELILTDKVFRESGGPPNQFIWRGKVRWSLLVDRPY